MEASRADVLVFVEDPGAANYLADVPNALATRGFKTALMASGHAEEYLRRRGIAFQAPPATLAACTARLLIAGTAASPDALGLRLISEARARGIPTAAAVDARMNAAIRFRGHGNHPLECAPDWLLVIDEWTKDAFAALGFPRARVFVCGHPRFDHVRAVAHAFVPADRRDVRRELFPGAPASSAVILFAAEPLVGFNQRDQSGSSRPETALRWLLDGAQAVAPQSCVVVRPHPKNLPGDFASMLGRFELADNEQDGLHMAWAADLVAGLTSTFLIEASLIGTPTLSIVPCESERNWLPTVASGVTLCATGKDEVRPHLVRLLEGEPAVAADALDLLAPPGALARIADFVGGVLGG